MANNNLKALRKLQSAMPVLDKQRQQQQQQARAVQLQQQVAQQPTTAPVTPTAQQLGAQAAQQAGQQEVKAAQQRQQQLGQMAQTALGAERAQAAEQLGQRQLGLGERQLAVTEELGGRTRSAEDQIFQNQVDFKRDELGRTTYQSHQQLDLALASAQSAEDFKDKMQIIEQATKENLAMLEATAKRLELELKGEGQLSRQDLTLEKQSQLQDLLRDTKNSLARKQAEAQATAAMYQGIGAAAGVGAALLIPGGAAFAPAAAAGGAALGAGGSGLLG
jgi:hypothetical protein